jgi:hypothetical protein
MASVLRWSQPAASVAIGCRRPFSPTAERLSEVRESITMKKSKSQVTSTEPMGIVITAGLQAPIEPLVRAYVWGPAPDEPPTTEGSSAA